MSLAEASQSRKERLEALRKRRAGEAGEGSDGYVPPPACEATSLIVKRELTCVCDVSRSIKIKSRNFDNETRNAKKVGPAASTCSRDRGWFDLLPCPRRSPPRLTS